MKVIRAPWKLENGKVIELVTPAEFAQLPDGTVLFSIQNERVVKGAAGDEGFIDNDTRGGMLAYGVPRPVRFARQEDLRAYEIEIPDAAAPREPK